MDETFIAFADAQKRCDGYLLASTIDPLPPTHDPKRLAAFYGSTTASSVQTDLRYKLQYNPDLQLSKAEATAWIEVFVAYHAFVGKLLVVQDFDGVSKSRASDWIAVYDSWKSVANALTRAYQNDTCKAWTIPCLYVVCKYLRIFAIKADEATVSQRNGKATFDDLQDVDDSPMGNENVKLEDAARQVNGIFSLSINDRNALDNSRKWAVYYIVNVLFKIYFRLNSVSLCKNILRSVNAAGSEMPPLTAYPRAHQVTFNYYSGVLSFLEEDYPKAETLLTEAFKGCSKKATRNMQMILIYLIPTKMLTTHSLPSAEFLGTYPKLEKLFGPVRSAVLGGDLVRFNAALDAGETEFVKRRIYLTLERGQDIIIRNLFRKVFIAGGYEPAKPDQAPGIAPLRRTRVPTKEFAAALQLAGAKVGDGSGGVDIDEVECLIANSIYKGLMKGYIARERGMVVLSKAGAFPGTGV